MARPTAVWIPFYINDYFSKTMHLTARQHGAYCCLIFHYWQAGGPIPDNDRVLSGLAKETAEEWAEDAPLVRAFFYPLVFDGRPSLGHARIEEEIVRAQGTQELRKAQTERATAARLAARERNVAPTKNVTLNVTLRESESHTESERKKEKDSCPKPPKGDFERFWDSVPRKVRKGTAKKAYAKALNRAPHELILAGIQRYAASRAGEDERYTAFPATWLNGDGWLDQASISGKSAEPDTGLIEIAERERAARAKMGF